MAHFSASEFVFVERPLALLHLALAKVAVLVVLLNLLLLGALAGDQELELGLQ